MTIKQRQLKARLLYANGLKVRQIADRLGVSVGTAHRDINPEADQRYRLASRERRRRANHNEREVSAT